MRRKHFLAVTLFLIVAAVGLVAWSNRPIPLTEEQKAWIARTERGLVDPLPETNAEWRIVLSRPQYRILRKQSTERPFDNEYWDDKSLGLYRCAGCGQPAFWSTAKYESGTGWPSFTQPVSEDRVTITEERDWFSSRDEVACSRCGGHLGHVFPDGPAPTNLRYCLNSAALHLDKSQRPSAATLETRAPPTEGPSTAEQ